MPWPIWGGNYQDSGCHTRATLLWSFPMRNTGCDEKGGGTNNLEQINKFDQLRIILSFFQDFSHDGQAPDVFFWADGTIIPYITRYISCFFGDVKKYCCFQEWSAAKNWSREVPPQRRHCKCSVQLLLGTVGDFHKTDGFCQVLLLPKEKPTIHNIVRLEVSFAFLK